MIRLPGLRGDADDEKTAAPRDDRSHSGGIGRKLLAAVAVGGAAYVAARRLRSSEARPAGEEDTDREEADSPEAGSAISIGNAVDERSPEEIAERVGEDVDDKPAEPGEMAIDDALVEDAVDRAELSGAGGDESDEAETTDEADEREATDESDEDGESA